MILMQQRRQLLLHLLQRNSLHTDRFFAAISATITALQPGYFPLEHHMLIPAGNRFMNRPIVILIPEATVTKDCGVTRPEQAQRRRITEPAEMTDTRVRANQRSALLQQSAELCQRQLTGQIDLPGMTPIASTRGSSPGPPLQTT